MEKRVTFKNASNQTNKRARLTHGEGGVVTVGNQTGAVYYENPELGMCYSKPMEITATVNEETQCISLVGLYDLFIDGKRIGRGMTQEEILERVNAGDYGVEVSPCLTVSCDGAPGKTNCLSLTGQWDVEINDTRIIENADEKRILAALKKNPLIRTEECRPLCVSTGEIVLNINDVTPDMTFPVHSEVVMVAKITSADSESSQFYTFRFVFRPSFISYMSDYDDDQVAWRDESQDPWTADYLLMGLAEIDLPGFTISKTPEDFEIGSLNYCKDGLINYESRIFFQNTYALSRETYYYTGGWALYLGSLTIPIVHMKLDGVELTPYTWTPSGQERTVIERAALEHFKTQLEARGITCSIIDDIRTTTPAAFNGGPVTSTLSLVVSANYRFSITTSKQWEGTAYHGELNNAENGWEEKSIGMHAYGQGFNSTGFATANGCSLGAASAQEVDLSVQIRGISENGPVPNRGTFTLRPATLEFVSLASEGIVLQSGQTDILTVFPQLATQEPLPTCGYYIVEEEGPM